MAKKSSSDATTAPAAKRTPEEKAQRKAEKAERKATKTAPEGKANKKDSSKQVTKAAHKQLRKDLDTQLNELSTRIRKETKAQVKDIMKQATQRFQTEATQLVSQAQANGLPAPKPAKGPKQISGTPVPATDLVTNVATEATTPAKRPSRPAAAKKPATTASAPKPAAPSRSRSRRPAASGAPALSTPQGTTNDSVAVDNV